MNKDIPRPVRVSDVMEQVEIDLVDLSSKTCCVRRKKNQICVTGDGSIQQISGVTFAKKILPPCG